MSVTKETLRDLLEKAISHPAEIVNFRELQSFLAASIDFCSQQASRNKIKSDDQLFEVPECSTELVFTDQRAETIEIAPDSDKDTVLIENNVENVEGSITKTLIIQKLDLATDSVTLSIVSEQAQAVQQEKSSIASESLQQTPVNQDIIISKNTTEESAAPLSVANKASGHSSKTTEVQQAKAKEKVSPNKKSKHIEKKREEEPSKANILNSKTTASQTGRAKPESRLASKGVHKKSSTSMGNKDDSPGKQSKKGSKKQESDHSRMKSISSKISLGNVQSQGSTTKTVSKEKGLQPNREVDLLAEETIVQISNFEETDDAIQTTKDTDIILESGELISHKDEQSQLKNDLIVIDIKEESTVDAAKMSTDSENAPSGESLSPSSTDDNTLKTMETVDEANVNEFLLPIDTRSDDTENVEIKNQSKDFQMHSTNARNETLDLVTEVKTEIKIKELVEGNLEKQSKEGDSTVVEAEESTAEKLLKINADDEAKVSYSLQIETKQNASNVANRSIGKENIELFSGGRASHSIMSKNKVSSFRGK